MTPNVNYPGDSMMEKTPVYKISNRKLYLVFTLIFFVNITINMHIGAIASGIENIEKDLDITDETMGLFGTLLFAGNLIGIGYLLFRVYCINIHY